jgi:hypothetical protein
MKGVNSIAICRDNYKSQYEFEQAVKATVMLLLNANYIMTVRYDEPELGIIVIEYNPADESWGCDYPHWMSAEEYESIALRGE